MRIRNWFILEMVQVFDFAHADPIRATKQGVPHRLQTRASQHRRGCIILPVASGGQ